MTIWFKNELKSVLAQKAQLAHALLIKGPRGIGKQAFGMELAQALLLLVGPLVHLWWRLPDRLLVRLMPMYDAYCRTLYRLLVSRRNLLEWETVGEAERRTTREQGATWRRMWTSPLLALVAPLVVGRRLPRLADETVEQLKRSLA